ncbi:hypothetical protein BH23PLA1_BH23PLA1_26470 [soil metagenome]
MVRCPQCRTDLVVPEPETETDPSEHVPARTFDPSPAGPRSSAEQESESSGLPFSIELDEPNFGPEDIRVLPGLDLDLPVKPKPPPPPPKGESAWQAQEPPLLTPLEEFEELGPHQGSPTSPPVSSSAVFVPPEPPVPTTEAGMSLGDTEAKFRGEARPILPAYSRRDVVMPRVAVIAWSLFVILALFLTFIAGLLVGHFLWIPTPSA